MKPLYFLLLAMIAAGLTGCSDSQPASKTNAGSSPIANTVGTEDFRKLLEQKPGAILVDVRTPQEFSAGHLPNALNININDPEFEQAIGRLDKDKAVLVYCAAGARSARAMQVMRYAGFREVYNMGNGYNDWSARNLPTQH